jgi:hypothetical protein
MIDFPMSGRERWAGRRNPWDIWLNRGMSGDGPGTSGAPVTDLVRAYLAIAAFATLVTTVNVLSALHEVSRAGRIPAVWEPITAEFTGGVTALAWCGIVYAALRRAPPGHAGWVRMLSIHGGASFLYSALHFGSMMSLRAVIYAAAGLHYRITLTEFPYECRKDVLSYLILAGIFWIFAKPVRRVKAATTMAPAEPPIATFDIQDGNRILRLPVRDILLLRAAGNYVEFLLEDGSKPLMRASLREMETVLAPQGFVRTHRSWLVNGRRLRALRPAGSGDFQIELDGGTEAPLSRRFPAALARLRASGDAMAG